MIIGHDANMKDHPGVLEALIQGVLLDNHESDMNGGLDSLSEWRLKRMSKVNLDSDYVWWGEIRAL